MHATAAHAAPPMPPIPAPTAVLSTLRQDGRRRWLHPRLAAGAWFRRRRIVAWALIALFNALPFLRVGGAPALQLDLVAREFHLFGLVLLPSDLILVALLMVGWILLVFLTTAVAGRIWCGWACPQTVYMEFVFRPIERLCFGRRGVGGKPAAVAPGRHLLRAALYLAASLWLAHVFLAYFVGADRLFGLHGHAAWLAQSPVGHPGGFLTILIVTGAMLFDFAFFREQMCTLTCPYGRFQSVLLDPRSLVVAYDLLRGEPRGKSRKELKRVPLPVLQRKPARGDCVDCGQCVAVCPTGIDIRQGLQMECLHCTACMDACDSVMRKFGRAPGLIRYARPDGAAPGGWRTRLLRPRVVLYALALSAVTALFVVQAAARRPAELFVRRAPSTTFALLADGRIENVFVAEVSARSARPQELVLAVEAPDGIGVAIEGGPSAFALGPGDRAQRFVRVRCPKERIAAGATVRLHGAGGRDQVHALHLLGPYVPAAAPSPIPPTDPRP